MTHWMIISVIAASRRKKKGKGKKNRNVSLEFSKREQAEIW